jgi:hypothetical protein
MDSRHESVAAKTATTGWELGRNQGAAPYVAGSAPDEVIDRFGEEVCRAMPLAPPDQPKQDCAAMARATSALARIAPQDDLEAIMATQLLAAHAAVIACYEQAMKPDADVAWRRENLTQAARLTRATVTVIAALQRYRINAAKAAAHGARQNGAGSERSANLRNNPMQRRRPRSRRNCRQG